jgi:ATP-dependent DNA ligase
MRCALYPLLHEFRTEKCPFTDLPEKRRTLYSLTCDEMQKCQWLKPLVVAQIEFAEWTPDGHLRHASLPDYELIKNRFEWCANKKGRDFRPGPCAVSSTRPCLL